MNHQIGIFPRIFLFSLVGDYSFSVHPLLNFMQGLEEGQFERVVQMQIRNSPPAQLLLRANVIVPEVTLSSQRLLFNK